MRPKRPTPEQLAQLQRVRAALAARQPEVEEERAGYREPSRDSQQSEAS